MIFACQQAIEKTLKALYVKKTEKTPAYTHNLVKLLEDASLLPFISYWQRDFAEEWNAFYRESRYTGSFDQFEDLLTHEAATEILRETEEFIQWLRSRF